MASLIFFTTAYVFLFFRYEYVRQLSFLLTKNKLLIYQVMRLTALHVLLSFICGARGFSHQVLHQSYGKISYARNLKFASSPTNVFSSKSSTIEASPSELNNEYVTKGSSRFLEALPAIATKNKLDETDKTILKAALPSMLNMAVVPIVNAVDTLYVGRLGITLALAGQAAANQAFFSLFFLVSFLPTITAPRVAAAVGSGDMEDAKEKVCEAIFLSNFLGLIGMIMLVGFPKQSLIWTVLSTDAPAMAYAIPYLRFRALSMIPALISSTGFAAYRGCLNTVTPLKVSLVTNLLNLIADPLLMFGLPGRLFGGMGFAGAALATAGAETVSGFIYMKLLLRKKLVDLKRIFQIPTKESLKSLFQSGSAMLAFQMTINLAFLTAARRVQALDPTGVGAAAYGIIMQIYSVGVVCHLGMKATAATLVPSERSKNGDLAARKMADKMFLHGSILGLLLGFLQMAIIPYLVPIFTTIPEVQDAIKIPALISSFIQFANGPLFAGEGVMVGLQTFKALTLCTMLGSSIMIMSILSPIGSSLNGIFLSLAAFNSVQAIAMVFHHLKKGPLSNISSNQ
jgi:putative MATE family efflux protein